MTNNAQNEVITKQPVSSKPLQCFSDQLYHNSNDDLGYCICQKIWNHQQKLDNSDCKVEISVPLGKQH